MRDDMVEQLQIEITWDPEYLGGAEFSEPVQQVVTDGVFGHAGLLDSRVLRWYRPIIAGVRRREAGEIADIDGESLYSCGTVLFR
ncbi:hypothetical protein GCM10009856_25080 [Mycolicibacterium llatzerense]